MKRTSHIQVYYFHFSVHVSIIKLKNKAMFLIWNKLKKFSAFSKEDFIPKINLFAQFSPALLEVGNDVTQAINCSTKNSISPNRSKDNEYVEIYTKYLKLRNHIDLSEFYFSINDFDTCITHYCEGMKLTAELNAIYELHDIMMMIYKNYRVLIDHNPNLTDIFIYYISSSFGLDLNDLLKDMAQLQDPKKFYKKFSRIKYRAMRQNHEASISKAEIKHILFSQNDDMEVETSDLIEINTLMRRLDLEEINCTVFESAIDLSAIRMKEGLNSHEFSSKMRSKYQLRIDNQKNLLNKATNLIQSSHFEKALSYAKGSLAMAILLRNQIQKDQSLKQLALVYIEKAKSIIYHSRCIYVQSVLVLLNEADSYLNMIGITYIYDVDLLNYFDQLGLLYSKLGAYEMALYWYKKEIRFADKHGNISYELRARRHLAQTYTILKRFDDAICTYLDATSKSLNELDNAFINLDMAWVLLEQGDHQFALILTSTAQEVFEKLDNHMGQIKCYNLLSKLYLAANNIENALKYAKMQKQMAMKIPEKYFIENIIANLNIFNAIIKLKLIKKKKSLWRELLEIFDFYHG